MSLRRLLIVSLIPANVFIFFYNKSPESEYTPEFTPYLRFLNRVEYSLSDYREIQRAVHDHKLDLWLLNPHKKNGIILEGSSKKVKQLLERIKNTGICYGLIKNPDTYITLKNNNVLIFELIPSYKDRISPRFPKMYVFYTPDGEQQIEEHFRDSIYKPKFMKTLDYTNWHFVIAKSIIN